MKKAFFTVFGLCLAFTSFAQETAENDFLLYSDDDVKIYKSSTVNCDDKKNGINYDMMPLTFMNKSENMKHVSFSKEIWYNKKCINCNNDSEEYEYSLSIPPKTTLTGQCFGDKATFTVIKVNSKGAKSVLTDLNLVNIKVK